MSRLCRSADRQGLVLVAQDDLTPTSATALTVYRRFRSHRFSGRFGARNLSLAGAAGVAVTQMGVERRCAHREGFCAFVAEGFLLPAYATSRLFVPTLYGLAVAVLPHLGRPRGGVGGLNGVLGLTDCPAAIARITDFVPRGRRCLLAGGSRGGLLGLPDRGFGDDRGFGNDRRFGNILVVIFLGRRAGWLARRCVIRTGSLQGRLLFRRGRLGRLSWRVVAIRLAGEDSAVLSDGHAGYRQQQEY
jgi:hypothetical protein